MEKPMIPFERFLELPVNEVAALVKATGQKVVVFPTNGTRRWFMLEHADKIGDDFFNAYMDISIKNHVHLCSMLYDHGIQTIIAPVFGRELMHRGDEYTKRVGMDGLIRTATDKNYREFFEKYKVRVRFYGDYRDILKGTEFESVLGSLYDVMDTTKHNTQFNLYFGVFADESTDTISRLSVEHYLAHGAVPDKATLIHKYYGEDLPPVSIFLGFEKFAAFDYPLLSNGNEDMYFSISPSPYMTDRQLRAILYDHIYTRRVPDADYAKMEKSELDGLREFYRSHKDSVLGVGELKFNIWIHKGGNDT
jgi:tuberculosinol/isotuberculosinol synthase